MRILIADDDAQRADRLLSSLGGLGHSLEHVKSAVRAEAALESSAFDLVILYLGIDGSSGAELITRVRHGGAAAALLALARGTSAEERIEALDRGADDCVSAPVSTDEVVALVRVWYRRTLGAAGNIVNYGPLSIDASDGAVFLEGQPVPLSRRDLSILELLLQRKGRVVTKDHLMDRLFGWGDEVSMNCIEVSVHRLRKKIERGSVHIQTLRGQGYRLEQSN